MGRKKWRKGKVFLVLLLCGLFLGVGLKAGSFLWNAIWGRGEEKNRVARIPDLAIPPPVVITPPRVVIIIDDLGGSFKSARALMDLGHPITFSILPRLPHSKRIAEEAHLKGYEVLLHLPLEPHDYPEKNPGEGTIFTGMSGLEMKQRFLDDLEAVPYAIGVNNHMGSRLTEDREAMKAILEEAKRRNLFFVDSLTSGRSVALSVANELDLPALRRQVFLDNVAEKGYIKGQIFRLAQEAIDQGSAIGIGHPYKATIEALKETLPELERQGIRLVKASELVK